VDQVSSVIAKEGQVHFTLYSYHCNENYCPLQGFISIHPHHLILLILGGGGAFVEVMLQVDPYEVLEVVVAAGGFAGVSGTEIEIVGTWR